MFSRSSSHSYGALRITGWTQPVVARYGFAAQTLRRQFRSAGARPSHLSVDVAAATPPRRRSSSAAESPPSVAAAPFARGKVDSAKSFWMPDVRLLRHHSSTFAPTS